MHALTAADLLALWERGAGLHAIDRALQVLALALPDRDSRDLSRLTLGCRDGLLLDVRRAILGDRIDAQDVCPACGERVEVDLACSTLVAAGGVPPPDQWAIEHDGYRLTLRPLDSVDAAAAVQCGSVASARATLLVRSILSAERDGEIVNVDDLPAAIGSAVAASIAAHDAAAELTLEFTCPGCHHDWRNVLDVASFVWTELAARAQRLLVDVHTLARAYGWSEADILAIGDARRNTYLALVTA